ncbi:hypothetical protein BEWA_000050 [Theileria equi strain WA]|uniref:Signal peptide-containing protein n=1 Tax=Theileria equi strain WA TaxID=1537102 RepID=L1LBG8_THEEQ|nr:hypothetical protein BEWA_000050 [Theileria equi strain WA]EKX72620.1 hypothetical protein BEWA_000050 [Theileria equi strain WA]|eukprot:XP_004832072.1 hypothetical protein BEWA_000050 [Theileria equi strain WA]
MDRQVCKTIGLYIQTEQIRLPKLLRPEVIQLKAWQADSPSYEPQQESGGSSDKGTPNQGGAAQPTVAKSSTSTLDQSTILSPPQHAKGTVTIPVDVTAEAGGHSGQIPGQQPPGPEPLSIFLLVPTLKMMLVLLVMKKTLFFLVEVQ